jgi:hypothetical protein
VPIDPSPTIDEASVAAYAYADWYQRLVGLAERGWMPVVIHDDFDCSLKKINLFDLPPEDWKTANEKEPSLSGTTGLSATIH